MQLIFRILFFVLLFFSFSSSIKAENISFDFEGIDVVELKDINYLFTQDSIIVDDMLEGDVKKVKFKRGKAIIFCVLTGFLGGHRIYLGTHQRTPIIYSITLGGLGVLPLVDLIHIIFTKDLAKFENQPEIIMWRK